MKAKDDLTKLCDELEYRSCSKRCCCNEIVCTKKIIKDYVDADRNKLLRLKAQLEIHDKCMAVDDGRISLTIAVLSLAIASSLSVIKDVISLLLITFLVLFLCMYILVHDMAQNFKDRKRKKWREYIRVCLEDIEKEI